MQDEGISGKSINRPSIKKLLGDSESNHFNMVMVWKISRLSRKQLDFLNIMDQLEKMMLVFLVIARISTLQLLQEKLCFK
ncbi:recombinase family protein [Cytobacillus kochii]|uniref:recombinase family protein n=1 Tax=Cytobacillus kochii TaxID=859143 RepID=UPI002E1F132D